MSARSIISSNSASTGHAGRAHKGRGEGVCGRKDEGVCGCRLNLSYPLLTFSHVYPLTPLLPSTKHAACKLRPSAGVCPRIWYGVLRVFQAGNFSFFLTRHSLSQLLRHALEIPEGDVPGLVVVEEIEHLVDVFPRVLIAHLGRHHVEELLEIDRSRAILPYKMKKRGGGGKQR